MTWRTPNGERILEGAEAKLFASAIATMIDMANDSGEGLNFGMPLVAGPFERLSMPQKYTVLEEVTRALLKPTPICPQQSAVNEGAIYYVFAWLKQEFDDAADGEEVWGQQIIDALKMSEDEEEDEDEEYSSRPKLGCLDSDRWESALDELADRILWDRDWEMEGEMGGGANVALMQMARIDPDYFRPYEGGVVRGAKDRLYNMVRAVVG